jgi:hypothetical protein
MFVPIVEQIVPIPWRAVRTGTVVVRELLPLEFRHPLAVVRIGWI